MLPPLIKMIAYSAFGMILIFFRYFIFKFLELKNKRLDYHLWDLGVTKNGNLEIAGFDIIDLAAKYGTPAFIVNKEYLRSNFERLHKACKNSKTKFEIFYSYKTNPVPGVIKALHEFGAGAEVISDYELWLAIKLGNSPDSIIYNGPNKTNEGLQMAIEKNIKVININSFNEIERIKTISDKLNKRPRVGVRITTNVGWGNQFGFSIKSGDAFKAFSILKNTNCGEIVGIHMHLGSDIKSATNYKKAIENACVLVKELKTKLDISIKYFDIGGGFGVSTVKNRTLTEHLLQKLFKTPLLPPKLEKTASIEDFISTISSAVQEEFTKDKLDLPVVFIEPGRAITSSSQLLLTRVGDIKNVVNGAKIALLDAGINVAYPATWEYHEVFCANKMNSDNYEYYNLAGPICTPTDLFIKSKKIPMLDVGDFLTIMDAGAYFVSHANNFSFTRPPVVIVSKGEHQISRSRETYEDMIRLDKI